MGSRTPGGLLADIREAKPRKGPRCRATTVRDALSSRDRADFDQAMADRGIAASAIAAVLRRRGHDISGATLQNHRRGDCCCALAGTG